jgi:transcription elongation factor GreB
MLQCGGMSKAFTRESDDVPELPALPRPVSLLPPGAKNYLTPAGATRLRSELERLVQTERPLLATAADSDTDAKRRLQALDQRIRHLQETLHTAVVTGPPAMPDGVVRFGATVTVRNQSGEAATYRIVGVDETDLDRNWVSWLSPIAKALMNAQVGSRVRLKLPGGEEELEILDVRYE